MRKLFYMGLEQIESRYSLQLGNWNEAVFQRRGIDYEIVCGQDLIPDRDIVTGSVLDVHNRSYYSLTQMAAPVKLMKEGKITNKDVIFFEDATTMGIESLPYIFDQVPKKFRPKVYVRFLANTPDPDDFLARNGSFKWSRQFELMINEFVDGILVANEEFVAHLKISGFTAPIYVTGLPFGMEEVASRVPFVKPIHQREQRVAFAARFDSEKQPEFYMKLAQQFYKTHPEVEFAVFTGRKELTSNDKSVLEFAKYLENSGTANFKVYTGLSKNDYYELLADSVVLFNCALQDWQSNTLGESGTFGTIPLYPAYRSFPESLANNNRHLYIPWSIDDAITKLTDMFTKPDTYNMLPMVEYFDKAIDRTVDIFEGKGEEWSRNTLDYRKHVAVPKYSWK